MNERLHLSVIPWIVGKTDRHTKHFCGIGLFVDMSQPCFPLLEFFKNLGVQRRDRDQYSSVFVYDKSWEEDEEDTTIASSLSSSSCSSEQLNISGEDAKTHYPEFGLEEDIDSDSDEQESIHDRVIFTSVNALVHSQSLCGLEIEESQQLKRAHSTPLIIPLKHFRWSEVTDTDDVRVEIHEVESWKDHPDLWWNANDFQIIKQGVVEAIRFCKAYHRNHIELLEEIIHSEEISIETDYLMIELAASSSDSFSRGLEGHMSKLFNRYRKKHSRKVLNAQVACRCKDQSQEEAWNVLREHSMEKSKGLSAFSRRMGEFDEIQAIAANKVTSLWDVRNVVN